MLILLATSFLYWVLSTSLEREEDAFLADKVRILRMLLRDRPEDATVLKQEVEWEWAASQYAQVYVRILDAEGQTTIETSGMAERLPSSIFPRPIDLAGEPDEGTEILYWQRQSFQALAAQAVLGPGPGDPYVIQVALDRTHATNLLASYRQRLWVLLGVTFILCVIGGYQLARRGLQPVALMTETARRIRSSTLHERLPVTGLPTELLMLATTFNEVLDRLEESFGRLSRFSADIAHELRTPVNNLRGEVEVALGKARSSHEYQEVLGSCLEEGGRLSRMIDSLLFVARAESPEVEITKEWIDVRRELTLVQEFYEAAAAETGITLKIVAHGDVTAPVDRTLFQRAVGNLLTNAIRHAPPQSVITVTATRKGNCVCVAVADTGTGIPAEHLPYLFDRFYRVDRSRSYVSGGMGLGLAIVKSILDLHGGSVEVSSEVGRGTCVTLSFPREIASTSITHSAKRLTD